MVALAEIRRAAGALALVFWGTLLCLFDLTFSQTANGEGWRFDVLNDALGTILIAVGVFRLGGMRVHERYARTMGFVKVIALLSVLKAVHDHWIYEVPEWLSFLFLCFGVASMAATVVFCVAMRWLSLQAGLAASARSWRTTTILFVAIYLIPLGIFYLAGAVALVTGTSLHLDLGPAGLLLLPVFFAPIVHLLISTRRMKREAERYDVPSGAVGGGFADSESPKAPWISGAWGQD